MWFWFSSSQVSSFSRYPQTFVPHIEKEGVRLVSIFEQTSPVNYVSPAHVRTWPAISRPFELVIDHVCSLSADLVGSTTPSHQIYNNEREEHRALSRIQFTLSSLLTPSNSLWSISKVRRVAAIHVNKSSRRIVGCDTRSRIQDKKGARRRAEIREILLGMHNSDQLFVRFFASCACHIPPLVSSRGTKRRAKGQVTSVHSHATHSEVTIPR